MNVPSHIIGLYYRTVKRYRKLATKLKRERNRAGYRYLTLAQKLKKLRKKIEALQLQLKIAAASGAFMLAVGAANPSHAQTTNIGPYFWQPRHLNPLREPYIFDGTTYPAIVDLDKDGDFDLLVADQAYLSYYGNGEIIAPMRYLVNIGSKTDPVYLEKIGEENPFLMIDVVNRDRGPVFADIDKDGDEDLFLALTSYEGDGIRYYRNNDGTFEEQTTAWDPVTKTGNPFLGLDLTGHQKITFGDIDNDTDLDAIITGQYYDPSTGIARFISYFKNDGTGTFTDATDELTFSPMPDYYVLNPVLADVDEDGDLDLVMGGYYLGSPYDEHPGLLYYRQVSPGNFVQETDPYDAVAKTGNPFYDIYRPNTQPLLLDIDDDGDLDLLVADGDGDHYYYFPHSRIHFYENIGNGVFEPRLDLDNPFGGVNVEQEASPALADLDGDGDIDALIGHKYDYYYSDFPNIPVHYRNDNGTYVKVPVEESPFGNVGIYGIITPTLVDIDADGDLDFVSGRQFGQMILFRNNDGVYTEEVENNPFANLSSGEQSAPEFADMDDDGLLDMVVANINTSVIRYFANTGTPQEPMFEERFSEDNPFTGALGGNILAGSLSLVDVDHDGDMDLVTSEDAGFAYDGTVHYIAYYENIGDAKNAVFQFGKQQPFLPSHFAILLTRGMVRLQTSFADQDGDGDLDLFFGDYIGNVRYVKNENPAVQTTVASGALTFRVDTDEAITIDPALTLDDEDDDLVVMATVTIANYEEGDMLTFGSQDGITSVFDPTTGVLTLRGKTTRAAYQALLRTVAYEYSGDEGGRIRPRKKATIAKDIEFRVFDTDFTTPQVSSRPLNVIFNSPPQLAAASQTTQLGNIVTIDLTALASDPDGNLDLSTLKVVQQPSSGAAASIDPDHQLVINYQGVDFLGSDHLTIEVCDDLGECAQSIVTIQITSYGEVEVYNALAPLSTGDNKFMRIHSLPEKNKVTIYNRWGDRIFEIVDYDSNVPGKRFEGKADNGKPLPTGTYFYKIEIPTTPGYSGPGTITGYIHLKQ